MTIPTGKVPNNFSLVKIERPQAVARAERIQNNEREIAKLESEISIRENNINITEKLFESSNRKISILEQLKSNNDELIGTHKEQRGLLQESRDLTKESSDLTQKMIVVIEKMIAIMEKNPAKYGQLSNTELQKQPEVLEAKTQVVQLANSKASEYPKGERAVLADIANNVVDATFFEIKATDIKANRELFINLPKRIEAALDKKHETLSVKDIKQIINDHYKSVEQFSRIKKLDYLDLALKDIKL